MNDKLQEKFVAVWNAVFNAPGDTKPSLRLSVQRRVAVKSGMPEEGDDTCEALPALLQPYVDKLATGAYKIMDEDVAALRRAGFSEDVLFELTVSGAVAAGALRVRRGRELLRGIAAPKATG